MACRRDTRLGWVADRGGLEGYEICTSRRADWCCIPSSKALSTSFFRHVSTLSLCNLCFACPAAGFYAMIDGLPALGTLLVRNCRWPEEAVQYPPSLRSQIEVLSWQTDDLVDWRCWPLIQHNILSLQELDVALGTPNDQ